MPTQCPLCDSGTTDRQGASFNCAVVNGCHCGPWELYDQDVILRRVQERDDRWLLSAWLRTRYERTGQPFRFKDRDGQKLPSDLPEPKVLQKIDHAVLLLANRTQGFGEPVNLTVQDVAPLLWARPSREVGAILQHLEDSGLATQHDAATRRSGDPLRYVLTAKGWQRADELQPLGPRGSRAFVAMWFADEFSSTFETGFAPALSACGYEPYLINRDHFSEKIDDRILGEIRRAALIVADFSGQRQNVYFETGFAMGLGVPVIWTCRHDFLAQLHFDVRQYPCLDWTTQAELATKLEDRVRALYPRHRAAGS
jgi:hypothetical protein